MTGDGWRYFRLLQQAGIADVYHYNLMLGHGCGTVEEVQELLHAMRQAEAAAAAAAEAELETDAPLPAPSAPPALSAPVPDDVTRYAIVRAWLHLGESERAATAIADVVAGWGRKRTRQYVVGVLRPLGGDDAIALFSSLLHVRRQGEGGLLVDRHSAKLVLRHCGGGGGMAVTRQRLLEELTLAGVAV
eukprot:COSAG05_NODE_6632_length_928_cov_1.120627_1_plen_189_part_00